MLPHPKTYPLAAKLRALRKIQDLKTEPCFGESLYEQIFALARPWLQTRENEVHTEICYAFAERLLSEEGGQPDIVVPAVLLHDIGWIRVPEHLQITAFGPKMTNPGLRDLHEQQGAEMAKDILAAVGYPDGKAEIVGLIVSRHDSRPDAESLEEAIVKDADKLSRYSREFLAIDSRRFGISPAENLSRLEGRIETWFLTPTARRLARAELEARRLELEREASPAVK
ncbi:MAG: HD domain-containing protein [Deltaproteobacteria bacterium]|nr:HD domain-containing protein [Deltaproteobacteria bacterium]